MFGYRSIKHSEIMKQLGAGYWGQHYDTLYTHSHTTKALTLFKDGLIPSSICTWLFNCARPNIKKCKVKETVLILPTDDSPTDVRQCSFSCISIIHRLTEAQKQQAAHVLSTAVMYIMMIPSVTSLFSIYCSVLTIIPFLVSHDQRYSIHTYKS